jgi:hypothetical protein
VVLLFLESILLRSAQGRKLLINTMLKAKLIKSGIFELNLIVIANGFQEVGMLIVQPQCQASKVLKHFILALQVENPRVMRIVINDDKNVPLASHGANPRRTDSVPGCSVIMVLTEEWEAVIILPRCQGAQTRSVSNLSKGNPWSRPKPLSRHNKSTQMT